MTKSERLRRGFVTLPGVTHVPPTREPPTRESPTHGPPTYDPPTYETVDGDRVRFLRTAADTAGTLLEMRMRYAPHPKAPPLHLHPVQDEHFEVLEGAMWTSVGGVERTYVAGESFDVPAGTPHAMRPAGGAGAEVIWQVRPALESEAFFRAIWGIGEDQAARKRGFLRMVATLRRFAPEFRLARPPFAVQRVLFTLLGPIADATGRAPKR